MCRDRTPRVVAVAFVACALAACGRKSAPPPGETSRDGGGGTSATDAAAMSAAEAHAKRAAWLERLSALVTNPSALPRRSDAAGAARLEALLSEPAWLELDGATFAQDGKQLIAFFPAIKSLALLYGQAGAADEAVLASLYMDRVSSAFVGAGLQWMASLNEPTEKRRNREQGMATVRLGKAMNLCGMIAMLGQASAPIVERATAHLKDAATYAHDSTESLQLTLVTLDALAPSLPPALHAPMADVRRVIGDEHTRRLAAAPAPPADVYEPLPIWPTFEPREVVSRLGGFAITVGPGALIWSTEQPFVSQLQWRDGDFVVEVHCVPEVTEEELSDRFRASTGAVRRADRRPGRWLLTRNATDQGMIRILAVAGRTCAVGAQAPIAQYDEKRADTIVGSFHAAP